MNSDTIDTIQAVLAERAGLSGALLPILHGIQDALGHVPADAVPLVAQALNLSRAEVHGVLTYYHHFRTTPPAAHVLQVCRAESCQAMGGEALWQHACSQLRGDSLTVEPVYCLGLCAMSPAVAVDAQPYARMSPARLDGVVQRLQGVSA